MQAIPSRVESGLFMGVAHWFGHSPNMPRYLMFGLIGGAFFLGMGVNNGDATKQAVTSVQAQYQEKLDYHRNVEKVIAKAATKAADACNHNLDAAIANDANAIKNCPQVPAVAKAIASQPATK